MSNDIPEIAQCTKRKTDCRVEMPPRDGQMKLFKLTKYLPGPSGHREKEASLVLVDSESGSFVHLDGKMVIGARRTCSLFSKLDDTQRQLAAEVSTFELGSINDVVLAFQKASSVEFVRIRDGRAECSERLIPKNQGHDNVPTDSGGFNNAEKLLWKFVPKEDIVLAIDPMHSILMLWKISQH